MFRDPADRIGEPLGGTGGCVRELSRQDSLQMGQVECVWNLTDRTGQSPTRTGGCVRRLRGQDTANLQKGVSPVPPVCQDRADDPLHIPWPAARHLGNTDHPPLRPSPAAGSGQSVHYAVPCQLPCSEPQQRRSARRATPWPIAGNRC